MDKQMVGRGVAVMAEKGGKILIEIDSTLQGELSKSKKNTVFASTLGNVPIVLEDGTTITLGLNAFRRAA